MTGNEVNIDPSSPFLRILEADSNSDLVTGTDSGTQSDLFVQGDIIGSDGYLVNSPVGEYGMLFATNETGTPLASNDVKCGCLALVLAFDGTAK